MQVPLESELTRDIPEPAAPLYKCRDKDGRATVCNRDHVNYTDALRTWGRALRGKLKEIRELQPSAADGAGEKVP